MGEHVAGWVKDVQGQNRDQGQIVFDLFIDTINRHKLYTPSTVFFSHKFIHTFI